MPYGLRARDAGGNILFTTEDRVTRVYATHTVSNKGSTQNFLVTGVEFQQIRAFVTPVTINIGLWGYDEPTIEIVGNTVRCIPPNNASMTTCTFSLVILVL